MGNFFSPFKVGLLLIIVMGSFVFFSGNVRNKLQKKDGNYFVHFYLKDATGLTSKSRVTIAGINVGEIENISLVGNKAKVRLILKKGTVLKSDAVAMKKNSSILGDSYVELTTGIQPVILKNGDHISIVRETSSMGGMMNKFDDIASDIKEMTSSLKEIIADQATTNSIKNTVIKLEEITVKVDALLSSNNKNIDDIMKNVRIFTESMKDMPARYDGKVNKILSDTSKSVELIKDIIDENRAQMKNLLSSANKIVSGTSSEDVNSTIKHLESVSASLERIVKNVEDGKGSLGKLVKSNNLHDDVEYIVNETSDMVSKISGVDLIVDAHSEYLMNINRGNHEFGLRFQPRPNKYYYLGVTASPYRVLTTNKTYIWGEDGENQATLKEKVYQENTIAFTMFMAYRLYFMTFKYGIFDSTGGMGIDFSILQDSVILNARINKFSDDVAPNIKLGLRYYPFETWFLNLGSVYMLDNRRDFYFGMGATFTDDDIKSLFSMGALSSSAGSMKK